MEGRLNAAYDRLRRAQEAQAGVRMTAGELFADEATIRLRNSRGMNATQTGTTVAAEWVLRAVADGRDVESFVEMTRTVDPGASSKLEEEMLRPHAWTRDPPAAAPPPSYRGAVVLHDGALAEFMNGGVIQTLGSARQKLRTGASTWEIGKSVLPDDASGDPLTVWGTRQMPYGVGADWFDADGIPSQRLALIRDNMLQSFFAGQRYAEYLGIPVTGEFGAIEVAAGSRPAADLLAEPHVEVAAFSWFVPDEDHRRPRIRNPARLRRRPWQTHPIQGRPVDRQLPGRARPHALEPGDRLLRRLSRADDNPHRRRQGGALTFRAAKPAQRAAVFALAQKGTDSPPS